MNELNGRWAYECAGSLLMALSFLVFLSPVSNFASFVLTFGVSFLLFGLLRAHFAFSNKNRLDNWGWYLGGGIVDMIMGGLLLLRSDLSSLALPLYVGLFLMLGSIAAVAKSIDLRETLLMIIGILNLFLSIMIIFNQSLSEVTVLTLIGITLMSHGIFYLALGLRLKKRKEIEA